MTPQEFSAIGQRLFGNRWKTPMAKSLGYSRETISRMANGHDSITDKVELAVRLLEQSPNLSKYKERHFAARGESITLKTPEGNWACFIHGDSRVEVKRPPHTIDAIVTDPVWLLATDNLAGSHAPVQLLADVVRSLRDHHPLKQIVIQLRCDGDPRFMAAVPPQYSFIRVA